MLRSLSPAAGLSGEPAEIILDTLSAMPTSTDSSPNEVTSLLAEIQGGRGEATDRLLPILYAELRRMARSQMARERPGQTLEPTALVHEAYFRLLGDQRLPWANRAHFFSAAAEAMRRILIERARRIARMKHGGGQMRVTLDPDAPDFARSPERFLALDRTLERLESRDPKMAQVVKLRFFAGLTVPETAAAINSSPRSVNRTWTAARAWLKREMVAERP